MAKKRAAKSSNGTSPTSVQLRIMIDVPDGTPSYYSNWIEVSHTKWDFCLTAAKMPARQNQTKMDQIVETKTLTLDADVQIIIPPTLLPGLIRALTSQKKTFEREMNIELKETEQ
jgi:hypothetical protein